MKILQSIEKYKNISNLSSLQILGELSEKLTHEELLEVASALRDEGFGNTITFSKKYLFRLLICVETFATIVLSLKRPKKLILPT